MSIDLIGKSSELPPPEVKEVADRIFCYLQADGSWGLNNAGFVVGRRGATVIDTCFTERRTRTFIDSIRGVTKLPLQTLINTHHHGDHTHGTTCSRIRPLLRTNYAGKPYWKRDSPSPTTP